jgi:hypothetical protein
MTDVLLPHEVDLLQRHAFVAENGVRERQVKKEVRERELDQEAIAAKGHHATAHRKLDRTVKAGFEGGRVDGFEIRDRAVDVRVEIGEGFRARGGRRLSSVTQAEGPRSGSTHVC